VQHAVEDIAGIPEFSTSQSVAAKAQITNEHIATSLNPVLYFIRGRRQLREMGEVKLNKGSMILRRVDASNAMVLVS
jgi:hypothetical protein